MEVSKQAIELIKQFEGFSTKPYKDSAGVWTIGYGSTMYLNGNMVKSTDRHISKDYAEKLLKYHLDARVVPYIKKYVSVELNQDQIDALSSWIYNLGAGNFKYSTLRKKINSEAPLKEIERHWKAWNKAGGKVLKGLVNRRNKEWELFTK